MKNLFLFLTMLVFTCPIFAQTRNLQLVKPSVENPTNEKRKAVVIGMSDYGSHGSLDNTINDADDMAEVFTRLGFEVMLLKNNDLRNLETNLSAWFKSIEQIDIAVFYFAGHGIEVNGQNYFIPVDAEINSQSDIRFATLNLNWVLDNMEQKGVVMKLLILDADRYNPFARGLNQGTGNLVGIASSLGTYIAFATSEGTGATDGGSYSLRNGVFTHFLKQELVKEGVTIDEIFNNVTGGVADMTNLQQIPFRYSSLRANYYFIPPKK